MGYRRNAKPTPTNIRNRLSAIQIAAESAAELAAHWNPKGRYFTLQRELLTRLPAIADHARLLRAEFERKAPRRRPRHLGDLSRGDFGKMLSSMLELK